MATSYLTSISRSVPDIVATDLAFGDVAVSLRRKLCGHRHLRNKKS